MKYPKQIDSVLRKNQTLGVDANLCLPTEEEYKNERKMPLEMHSNFSRFTLTILQGEKQGTGTTYTSVKANIPATDVDYINAKLKLAKQEILKVQTCTPTETVSIAYTQKLYDKNFKGKTPSEVLLANPEAKKDLLKVREFLEKNKEKYKANAVQIQAIDEAIQLLENGKLKNISASTKNIMVYEEPIKIPNANKVDENGLTFVYSISIVCMPDRDYSFAINIMNAKAPTVMNTITKSKTAEMSKIQDKHEFSMLLTEKEMVRLVKRMSKTLEHFEEMNFTKQFNLAQKNSYNHES